MAHMFMQGPHICSILQEKIFGFTGKKVPFGWFETIRREVMKYGRLL
jgi:hypothetical protein